MIFVSDDVEPSIEDPRLVEADVGVYLHSEGMKTEGATVDSYELSQ